MAALAAGGLTAAGPAAADDYFQPTVRDLVLAPGYGWETGGWSYGTPDGTVVYAFSKQPLTDAAWQNGGLPSGLTVVPGADGCKAYGAAAGVFTCPISEDNYSDEPTVNATGTAANNTTAYVGVGYAPRGTSIATAVSAAQLAGTTSDPETPTAAVITVKTPEQVAKSTVRLTTPDLPLSTSLTQTVRVHAEDAGYLAVSFVRTQDERDWDLEEVGITVTSVDGGPGATCHHINGPIDGGDTLGCDLQPGDHTVTYTLKSGANVAAWKFVANAVYGVWDYGPDNPAATSTFSVVSPYPVRERYRLYARDTRGYLYYYDGTGKASGPYGERWVQDLDWNTYTVITPLSRPTVHGTGDLVARDSSGVLWFYGGSGDYSNLKDRVKVGPGWNIFTTIVGAGDLTGDGKADLVARDASGVLWLYQGRGDGSFLARTKVGPGWNIFNSLTSVGDITGDGKADFVARDAPGVLWLYQGRGDGTYLARTKVGPGWNTYTALVGAGDLNSDGKADLIARDASGVLWLYQGRGDGSFLARTKIGPGWNMFDSLI